MLTRIIKRKILEIVSSSEFVDSLFGNEEFANRVVSLKGPIFIELKDGDMIVIPSSGVNDAGFQNLIDMLPSDRRVGIIAADDVKLLRLT